MMLADNPLELPVNGLAAHTQALDFPRFRIKWINLERFREILDCLFTVSHCHVKGTALPQESRPREASGIPPIPHSPVIRFNMWIFLQGFVQSVDADHSLCKSIMVCPCLG